MVKMNKSKLICSIIVIFTMLLTLTTIVNAAEAVAGNGTERRPYIINMDNAELDAQNRKYIEVNSNGENFHFKIEGNYDGRYCVEYDESTKMVKFIFIDNIKTVLYNRGSNGGFYSQAGTIPRTTTSTASYEDVVPFVIETKEKTNGNDSMFYSFALVGGKKVTKREFVLNNAANTDPTATEVPHPNFFVFVRGGRTAEELYKSTSEANCVGSQEYGGPGKNVRTRKITTGFIFTSEIKIMEMILDPRTTRVGEPSYIVRYAYWQGNESNPTITNKDNFTVDIVYKFVIKEEKVEEQTNPAEILITWMLIRNW